MLARRLKIILALWFFCGVSLWGASQWIWKLGDEEISAELFEKDYNSFLTMISWQVEMDVDQLKELLQKVKESPDMESNAFIRQIGKPSFASNYEDILLLNKDASVHGFHKKESTGAYLNFIRKYYLAQLYLVELNSQVSVSANEDELIDLWIEYKKENPDYAKVPIDEGMKIVKKKMLKEKQKKYISDYMKDIRKKYKLSRNPEYEKLTAD